MNKPRFFIIVAFVIYAAIYCWTNCSVNFNGQRHFFLHDDMMISMRYANNLVCGNGLTWNAHERVEGISNLLWTLIMTIPHYLGLPPQIAPAVMMTINILLFCFALILIYRLAFTHYGCRRIAYIALILSAFNAAIHTWLLQGFEVGLIMVLLLMILRDFQCSRSAWLPALLLPFIRHDTIILAVPALIIGVRYYDRKVYVESILLIAAFTARVFCSKMYYGDWLPNTFYLKATGYPFIKMLIQGIVTQARFLIYLLPAIFVILIKPQRHNFWLWIFAAQFCYCVWTGGDMFENGNANRFIVPTLPLILIIFSASLSTLISQWHNAAKIFAVIGWLFIFNIQSGDIERLLLAKPMPFYDKQEILLDIARADIFRNEFPGDTIAVLKAGLLPYLYTEPYYIDMLGKNDRFIAHSKSTLRAINDFAFVPGHTKWNLAYSLSCRPKIITTWWHRFGMEDSLILRNYDIIYVNNTPVRGFFMRQNGAK